MDFFGIGTGEFILILILILILVGPKKLQEMARMMGKTTRVIRKMGSDLSFSIRQELDKSGEEVSSPEESSRDIPSDINNEPLK